MAIDLCSDSSTFNMSPRYSFSHDLSSKPDNNNISLPVDDHHDLHRPSFDSLSNLDFDFNVRETTLHQDSSSADELFSDGMIRSVQIKKDVIIGANNNSTSSTQQKEQRHKPKSPKNVSILKKTYIPPPPMPPPHTFHDHHDDHDLKTTLESSENQKQNSTKSSSSSSSSFWRFKRSSSLNCGSGSGGYASSLCPLPLLSRSNSAGSASIDSSSSTKTKNHQKPPSCLKNSTSSSSSFGQIKSNAVQGSSSNYQKPPLKKGVYGSYGSNNTLLHVPSASIFGFGSIFSNGKVKNNKAVRTHI